MRAFLAVALVLLTALPAAGQVLAPSTAPRDLGGAAPTATSAPASAPRPSMPPAAAPVVATPDGLVPVPPLTSPVVDTTGTLDVASRRQLEQQALALQQGKGAQLQILMIPSTKPEEIEEYAVRAFEQYRLGRKKVDDGVLVVVAKDDRRARIEVGYGLEGAIPDAIASRVINEYMTPRFREGDYAGGLQEATQVLARIIEGEALPAPMARQDTATARDGAMRGNPILALIAAYFVAQLVRGLFGGSPALFRGLAGGVASGAIALLLAGLLFGAIGGLLGFFLGLAGGRHVRFARHAGFGGWGGGLGGGGFGGGGGGASGSW